MPDRYSDPERLDEVALAQHRETCSGWVNPDADHPQPCLLCKPHLRSGTRREVTDYAETIPSARARAAIERADRSESGY
ncbi:hypothetical protein [Nocardia sp. CA-290969]|uniref:hypothetical protein n=1 Tax=Nocardia sp. CA-290969 TaxID=3239986 RepID=UPI003D8D0C7F